MSATGEVGYRPAPAAQPSLAGGLREGNRFPRPSLPYFPLAPRGEISPKFICTEDAEAAAGEVLFLR